MWDVGSVFCDLLLLDVFEEGNHPTRKLFPVDIDEREAARDCREHEALPQIWSMCK